MDGFVVRPRRGDHGESVEDALQATNSRMSCRRMALPTCGSINDTAPSPCLLSSSIANRRSSRFPMSIALALRQDG
jgi:hypothetical protein